MKRLTWTSASITAVLALGAAVLTPVSQAGEVIGTVKQVNVRHSDGLVYVLIHGTQSGRPPCASNTDYWMIPNENSETGKKLYSLLVGAKLADRSVRIVGANTCTRWGDGEDINFVQLL